MKKLICLLLCIAMLFSLSACGMPKEIAKEVKLRTSNFNTYLNVEVSFGSVVHNYKNYEGDNEEYIGGVELIGNVDMTVNVTPKSTNEIEFSNCTATIQIDTGTDYFSINNVEITLDENGCYKDTIKLESKKYTYAARHGCPTIPNPVATCKVIKTEGDIKVHIKLDENGSVITASSEK